MTMTTTYNDENEIRTAYIIDPMTRAPDGVKQGGKCPYEELHISYIYIIIIKMWYPSQCISCQDQKTIISSALSLYLSAVDFDQCAHSRNFY